MPKCCNCALRLGAKGINVSVSGSTLSSFFIPSALSILIRPSGLTSAHQGLYRALRPSRLTQPPLTFLVAIFWDLRESVKLEQVLRPYHSSKKHIRVLTYVGTASLSPRGHWWAKPCSRTNSRKLSAGKRGYPYMAVFAETFMSFFTCIFSSHLNSRLSPISHTSKTPSSAMPLFANAFLSS